MIQTVKKAWGFVNTMLLSIVVLLAVALVGVRLFGIEIYTVLSGSMEPAYQTGSVIYVMEADTEELKAGDVITFQLNGGVIATHRIVEVSEENGEIFYRTKGDANDVADGAPVSAKQIVGKPIFTIPQLGYLVNYIQSPSGRYATIALGAFLLWMNILPEIIFGKNRSEKNNDKQIESEKSK